MGGVRDRVPVSGMRRVVAIAALVGGCSNRPLVDAGDDTSESFGTPVDDEGADDDRPRPDDDANDEDEDEAGDVDVDDGLDDEGVDESGPSSECADAEGPDVWVEVWPGQDPLLPRNGFVIRDFDCTIDTRDEAPGVVEIGFTCLDESGLVVDVWVSLEFDGLVVPADLVPGTPVQVSANTWRDPTYFEEFRWRRSDHFAIYRDGALALAGGSGAGFPTDTNGNADLDFFAPVLLDSLATQCPGAPMECHETLRDAWIIEVGDEVFQGPPFQIVQVGGYDLHLGELTTNDGFECDEPPFSRVGLAIARP